MSTPADRREARLAQFQDASMAADRGPRWHQSLADLSTAKDQTHA